MPLAPAQAQNMKQGLDDPIPGTPINQFEA